MKAMYLRKPGSFDVKVVQTSCPPEQGAREYLSLLRNISEG